MAGVDETVGLYLEAWNEPAPDRSESLLCRAVTDDVVFVGVSVNRDALLCFITQARMMLPGASVVRTGPIEHLDEEVRFSWEVRDRLGEPVMAGLDVMVFARDGRVSRITATTEGPFPDLLSRGSAQT